MPRNRLMMAISCIVSVCLGVSAALLSYSERLITFDDAITNVIYQYNSFDQADSRITLVTIDDASETVYGSYDTWPRSILADTVRTVSENGACVIGLDVDLSNPGTDKNADRALADACKNAGNVVALASVTFNSQEKPNDAKTPARPEPENGEFFRPDAADSSMEWSEHEVVELSLPYPELSGAVTTGISNTTQQSLDGTIRQAALSVRFDGEQYDSFASAVYKRNQDALGLPYHFPEVDEQDLFGFNVIWDTTTYQRISVCDLLSGNYSPKLLSDHIVLIGELQDFVVHGFVDDITIRRDSQDLLLQASMIQSLLRQRTVTDIPALAQAVLFGITIAAFYFFFSNRKIWFTLIAYSIFVVSFYTAAMTANLNGRRILLLVPLLYSVIALTLMLLQRVLFFTLERRKMEKTLKLYMDSSVVDQITETDPLHLAALSERKDIAVLFVDVRGFTTLSERLQPEQVVEILNAYFTIVANAIGRWGGTLDKFIGDAAMAIFNAPKPLPDYCLCAVCAADDIMKGFDAVKGVYERKFHLVLNIGIGINAGEAIVGNIGCYSRMDYTAIGDTVNTASRLESSAAPGQILISETVVNAVQERVCARWVGDLTLKGKTCAVKSFEPAHIDRPKQPPGERRDLLGSLAEQRARVGELIEENKERVGDLIEEQKDRIGTRIAENREQTRGRA